MIDDGDGEISLEDFLHGARCRGSRPGFKVWSWAPGPSSYSGAKLSSVQVAWRSFPVASLILHDGSLVGSTTKERMC